MNLCMSEKICCNCLRVSSGLTGALQGLLKMTTHHAMTIVYSAMFETILSLFPHPAQYVAAHMHRKIQQAPFI